MLFPREAGLYTAWSWAGAGSPLHYRRHAPCPGVTSFCPVLSPQSPRACCPLFLQACSHSGPPWAPFHQFHHPPAQQRPHLLRQLAQVSLVGRGAAGCSHRPWDPRCSQLPVLTPQQPYLGPMGQPPPPPAALVTLQPPPPQPLVLARPLASPSHLGWACLFCPPSVSGTLGLPSPTPDGSGR